MLQPLQLGKPNKHMLESSGPDTDFMKFYVTQYSTTHSWKGFQPSHKFDQNTGYSSNLRPGFHYSEKLDKKDNPVIGKLLADNYESTTKCDYTAPLVNDTHFPQQITKSGFTNNTTKSIFLPEINFFGSILHQQAYVSESKDQFKNKPDLPKKKDVGPKTLSGASRACGNDTLIPGSRCLRTSTLDFTTETQSSFRPVTFCQQETTWPSKSPNFTATNYNRLHPQEIHTPDAFETSSKVSLIESETQSSYRLTGQTKSNDNVSVGRKELSGYLRNNPKTCLHVGDDSQITARSKYTDDYRNKSRPVCVDTLKGYDLTKREANNYTRPEFLRLEGEKGIGENELNMYVDRSLTARDPFYTKQNVLTTA